MYYLTWQKQNRGKEIMEHFDIVIVGAGPAGLKCAEILGGSRFSVLLAEKKDTIGSKVCAGGLTALNREFSLPLEKARRFDRQSVVLNGKEHVLSLINPLYVMDRLEFGKYHLDLVQKHPNIVVETGTVVREVHDHQIVVNNGRKIHFDFLVGADGAASIVRKHLGLENRIYVGMQYRIPVTHDKMVFIFNPGMLRSGYSWVFPHHAHTSAGVFFNPKLLSSSKARASLHTLLDAWGLDYKNAQFEFAPLNCLYRGIRFNNIFLAGDAAGLASAGTGEGISYALTSGEEIAGCLISGSSQFEKIRRILRFKRRQEFILSLLDAAPRFNDRLFKLFISLIKLPSFQRYFGS
jgi:geranylgeranyl reductase